MTKLQDYLLRYMEYCFRETVQQVYETPKTLIEPNPEAVLLDCGCANGRFSRSLAGLLGSDRIYGVEIHKTLAREALSNGVRVVSADLNRPVPLRSMTVGIVTAFNVLEHLVETQQFLEEIWRILVPGGYAIINTPNLASWHNIMALLFGLQPFSGPNIISMTESDFTLVKRMHRRAHKLSEHDESAPVGEPERYRHIVVVAFRSLKRALENIGFRIEVDLGFGYYPLPPLLARIAARLNPSHAHHMVIMARKPFVASRT